MKLATSKIKGTSFFNCLDWCPDEKNLFHIVDKGSGKPLHGSHKLLSNEAFFFLNFINSYEDGQNVIIDLVGYDSPDILKQMFLEKLRNGVFETKDKSKIMRFVIPMNIDGNVGDDLIKDNGNSAQAVLNKKKVILHPHLVCQDQGCEHPSINRNVQGRKYKYSYVIGYLESVNKVPFANAVTKVDMDNGQVQAWKGDEFTHPVSRLLKLI